MATQARKATSSDADHKEGLTPPAELKKVPTELDQPDEITPANTVLHGECRNCGSLIKLNEDGKVLPHRVHGHGAPDDDPICDGTGKTPAS